MKYLFFLCLILAGCASQPAAVNLTPPGFTNSPTAIAGPILKTQAIAVVQPPVTNAIPSFIFPPVIYSPGGQSYVATDPRYYQPVKLVECSTNGGMTFETDTNFPAGTCFRVTVDPNAPQKLYRITPP